MRHRFLTADVFTDTPFGGNQLAVFPDARELPESRMQDVAREFNFSETVFVLPADSPEHTRRLRIFTPGRELPFAGHPTLGAAHVLAAIGEIPLAGETTRIVFEEGVGPVAVAIRSRDGSPVFTQLTAARRPEFGPGPPPPADLARVVGLDVTDMPISSAAFSAAAAGKANDPPAAHDAPAGVSCGVPFLIVPLRDRTALGRARLDLAAWSEVLEPYWASMLFLFCRDPERRGSDLRARLFAPGSGIPEDPATGAAGVALAAYLASGERRGDGTHRWTVEQGFELGRPSILEIEADVRGGRVEATRVGGASVLVSEGTMEVPEPC